MVAEPAAQVLQLTGHCPIHLQPPVSSDSQLELAVSPASAPALGIFVRPSFVQSGESVSVKLLISGWGMIMHAALCFIVQICVCDVVGTDK